MHQTDSRRRMPVGREARSLGTRVHVANLRAFLRALRRRGELSSPVIGTALGVNPTTVSRLASRLAEAGLILNAGPLASNSVGRPAHQWRLNHDVGVVVGVSLRAVTATAIALDLSGNEVSRVTADRVASRTPSDLVDVVADLAARANGGSLPTLAAGLAIRGLVEFPRGEVTRSPEEAHHGPGLRHFPLRAELERRIGCPVLIDSGSNLAALAVFHHWVRAGEISSRDGIAYHLQDEADQVVVGWHTMGLVLDGALYRGRQGAVGQVGLGGPWDAESELLVRRALRGEGLPGDDVAGAMDSLLTDGIRISSWLAPRRVVYGGDVLALMPVIDESLAAVNARVAGHYARTAPDIEPFTLWRDPLWPHTLALGAGALALDHLFDPVAQGDPDLLAVAGIL